MHAETGAKSRGSRSAVPPLPLVSPSISVNRDQSINWKLTADGTLPIKRTHVHARRARKSFARVSLSTTVIAISREPLFGDSLGWRKSKSCARALCSTKNSASSPCVLENAELDFSGFRGQRGKRAPGNSLLAARRKISPRGKFSARATFFNFHFPLYTLGVGVFSFLFSSAVHLTRRGC